MPLISLSSQKDIALEVKVTNLNGDEAHEASLAATFPRSLTYSEYHIHIAPSVSLFSSDKQSPIRTSLF